ncbi:MAG: 50S ribosomal protein L10 [Acidimicrobiia bacterium]
MPRPEKVQAVADIRERIEGAQAVFLAEYAGLSVKDQQALRRSLRENGAEFKVVKMSMARLAAAELDIDTLDELLLGPTGLAFADGDPAGAAKVLKDFAKNHDTFAVKGGLLGLEFLPPEKIAELAELEPREVLLAKLAGVMQAPMANLAGLLAALPRNTAYALSQLLEKKEAEAPAEVAVEEAPVESAELADEAADADDADEASTASATTDTTAEASDDASADAEVADDASADAEVATADGDSDDASADAEVADAASTDVEVATADPDIDDKDQSSAVADDEE